jgi:hypothetical protein
MGGPAADIGGVTGEKLHKARVAELAAKETRQRQARDQRPPDGRAGQGGAQDRGKVRFGACMTGASKA